MFMKRHKWGALSVWIWKGEVRLGRESEISLVIIICHTSMVEFYSTLMLYYALCIFKWCCFWWNRVEKGVPGCFFPNKRHWVFLCCDEINLFFPERWMSYCVKFNFSVSTKSSTAVSNNDNNQKCFLSMQIIILERFLKDHVTLKTRVMILKIQLYHHINYI